MNGILNVYKEPGFTSHDVVAKLRGICRQKKIGHTGTLDPAASGVLPVCLGNATKLCEVLTDKTKEYRARLRLGCVTDTQDMTGTVLEEHPVGVMPKEVERAVLSFVGEQEQIPPMYSALKVDGKKLCDLARAGKVVERKGRPITVFSIHIEEMDLPYVTMTVSCSKGTYIRTLCHDIGQKLGCGGVMDALVRTRSGQFRIEEAYRLSEIEEMAKAGTLEAALLPTDTVFANLPRLVVRQEAVYLADNGNPLGDGHVSAPKETSSEAAALAGESFGGSDREADSSLRAALPDGAQVRIYSPSGKFYGVYEWQEAERRYKPVRLFLGKES